MLLEKVQKTIEENELIGEGDHVVIGVSGGPDSVCLLHILWRLAEEMDMRIHAVHVNHELRGEAADHDEAYTAELCEALDIPCHVFRFDVAFLAEEEHLSLEEAGRKARYQAFDEVRKEILSRDTDHRRNPETVKVAVAQNMNDQAETVLMRILRGTGPDGLAGMDYKRDAYLIRPLLDVNRTEIEAYCEEWELHPCIDQTNLEPAFTRNKVRLELIPFLEKSFNPGVTKALSRLSRIAAEDRSFMSTTMPEMIIDEETAVCGYLLEEIRKKHPAISKRAITAGFKKIGLIQDISAIHLEKAEKLIREGKTSEQLDFPGGYGIRILYDRVELYKKTRQGAATRFFSAEIPLEDMASVSTSDGVLEVRVFSGPQCREDAGVADGKRAAVFDLDGVSTSGLVLRNRSQGDWIRPSGMSGTKKLQNYFVDSKIPRQERDELLLVCMGSEVLWIVGRRCSENCRPEETSRAVIRLEYKCNKARTGSDDNLKI